MADDGTHNKRLWVYSILIVLASLCVSGTPILLFVKLSTWTAIGLGIAGFVIFIYATIWFGNYLKLTGSQWFAAFGLLVLAWAGSAIYLVTRKPNAS